MQYQNLSTRYDAFQYCDIWPTSDDQDLQGCTDCLQAEGRHTLANCEYALRYHTRHELMSADVVITALQAGCQQKPAEGLFIGLEGDLFSPTPVQISAPSSTGSLDSATSNEGSLSLGAKAGIGVGAGAFLLIILGCGVVLVGRRRRRKYLHRVDTQMASREWPLQGPGLQLGTQVHVSAGGYDDTPLSQRPLHGWDDSPVAAHDDGTVPMQFSPYASQANSPVGAQDVPAVQWPPLASEKDQGIGYALTPAQDGGQAGGHQDAKGKGRQESYEMHGMDGKGDQGAKEVSKVNRHSA